MRDPGAEAAKQPDLPWSGVRCRTHDMVDLLICYHLAMNYWVSIGLIASFSIASSVVTYLVTVLRAERQAAERMRTLAETVTALESERTKFEQVAKGIEENAKRKALDEFLADLRVEERRYVREHRILFAHRKSLVLQERIFFRSVPISSWVEHEVPVEEGADFDAVARTLRVFDAIGDGTPMRASGALSFSK
jgi:hypothetical protein